MPFFVEMNEWFYYDVNFLLFFNGIHGNTLRWKVNNGVIDYYIHINVSAHVKILTYQNDYRENCDQQLIEMFLLTELR